MIPADTVHHIFPADEFPAYVWEDWNLISLAASTHDSMHDRKSGALTERGIKLLRRTARRHGIPIPNKYAGGLTEARP